MPARADLRASAATPCHPTRQRISTDAKSRAVYYKAASFEWLQNLQNDCELLCCPILTCSVQRVRSAHRFEVSKRYQRAGGSHPHSGNLRASKILQKNSFRTQSALRLSMSQGIHWPWSSESLAQARTDWPNVLSTGTLDPHSVQQRIRMAQLKTGDSWALLWTSLSTCEAHCPHHLKSSSRSLEPQVVQRARGSSLAVILVCPWT